MDRRTFVKGLFAGTFLPFLPKGMREEIPFEKDEGEIEKREIWLQRSHLAGFQYYDGEQAWPFLKEGELLSLTREPSNPHDFLAVEVICRNRKIGYVPRYENANIANLMDQNASLVARIKKLDESKKPWRPVEFDVYLLING